MATVGSDLAFEIFLAERYQTSEQAIGSTEGSLEAMAEEASEAKKKSIFEKLDPRRKLNELKQVAEATAEHLVQLIVVFVLQTLILPLLVLWGLYVVLKGTFGFKSP